MEQTYAPMKCMTIRRRKEQENEETDDGGWAAVFMQKSCGKPLRIRVLDGIISNMKIKPIPEGRSRAEILASIANLSDAIQGSISSYDVQTSSGRRITYHKLQYWADGKNHAIHIPKERLEEFKAAVKNGGRLRELIAELTEATARDILSSAPSLKKKSSRSPSGARPARRR